MDLKKMAKVISSDIVHKDILGNSIASGDIVAVAYKNKMYYGLVEKANDKYLKILNKLSLDNNIKSYIGRGIIGENCVLINKNLDSICKDNISKKATETILKYKQDKVLSKKFIFKIKDKLTGEVGLFVTIIENSNKTVFEEKVKEIQKLYPNYEFFVLLKNDTWGCGPLALRFSDVYSCGKKNILFYYQENNECKEYTINFFNIPLIIEYMDQNTMGLKFKEKESHPYKDCYEIRNFFDPDFVGEYGTNSYDLKDKVLKNYQDFVRPGNKLNFDFMYNMFHDEFINRNK